MADSPIRHESINGVHVVGIAPDAATADLDDVRLFFSEEFLGSTADDQLLIVDLSGVNTLDSSCLGPLVQRLRELQDSNGTMVLCGVKSQGLREIFALTRFDKIFPMVADKAAALAYLDEQRGS